MLFLLPVLPNITTSYVHSINSAIFVACMRTDYCDSLNVTVLFCWFSVNNDLDLLKLCKLL